MGVFIVRYNHPFVKTDAIEKLLMLRAALLAVAAFSLLLFGNDSCHGQTSLAFLLFYHRKRKEKRADFSALNL